MTRLALALLLLASGCFASYQPEPTNDCPAASLGWQPYECTCPIIEDDAATSGHIMVCSRTPEDSERALGGCAEAWVCEAR